VVGLTLEPSSVERRGDGYPVILHVLPASLRVKTTRFGVMEEEEQEEEEEEEGVVSRNTEKLRATMLS